MVFVQNDQRSSRAACRELGAGALELADIPKRLLVLGGGIIGLEMATVYHELGSKITVVELMDQLIPGADPDVEIFHAGTTQDGERVIATGGRVLGVTARGPDIADAKTRAYAAVDKIDWPGGFCRRDIGWRAIARKG